MQDPVNLFVAFSAGAFSFLSPCVLPLFPSYLAFITGMSIDELSDVKSRSLKPVITNSMMFIAGFSIVFIATRVTRLFGRTALGLSKHYSGSGRHPDYFFWLVHHGCSQAHFFGPLYSTPNLAQTFAPFYLF